MPKASDPEKTAWDGGSPKERKSTNPSPVEEHWTMRLYVAGQSSRSVTAITNLRRLCEEHMGNRCTIEIIDLVRNPELARADQVVAIPTLVRKMPPPVRRIIGDLSATEKVLVSLEIESGATS
ncbi:MAG TPA: circadian clock KaiB family protein [Candidatus Binataceae bacterium]|nr:circadian clock KaiB family protein [Candidatus Binataceae bacterium]